VSLYYSGCVWAQEKKFITWANNNAAPFYISTGKYSGQGFSDLTQQLIIEQMPQYQHKTILMPVQRVIKQFKADAKLCFSAWIYQSYREHVYTTMPNIYYFPHGIITLKSKRQLFPPAKVSLDAMLQQQDLSFGKAKGRGYGDRLNSIVERYQDNDNFLVRSAGNTTTGVLKMLQAKRIDYTFDYHFVMRYYERVFNQPGLFSFIPVVENQGAGVLGAIACSRNPWGASVIKDINEAIIRVRNTQRYRDVLNDYLIAPGMAVYYWHAYEQQVLTVTE